jgi:hypothetical protein
MALNYKVPGRMARKLEVMDATLLSGDCPGHPLGSHEGGVVSDFQYFTRGTTNQTQVDSRGYGGIVKIWTDGVLNDMFDKERNLEFVLMYLDVFPDHYIIMDGRIKAILVQTAYVMYGNEARDKITYGIQGDDDPEHKMNHDVHMHASHRGVINWNAKL